MAVEARSLPRPPSARPKMARRPPSPPSLPPRWGQAVAPPPTPFSTSPTEPLLSDIYHEHAPPSPHRQRRHHRHHRHRRHRPSSRSSTHSHGDVITYTYRFSDCGDAQRVYRPLPHDGCVYPPPHGAFLAHANEAGDSLLAAYADCESEITALRAEASLTYLSPKRRQHRPSPEHHRVINSASSYTTGSSPEAFHPTSPASPEWTHPLSSTLVKSALKPSSSVSFCSSIHAPPGKPAKSVQWMSDVKRRARDISADRKIVKRQVVRVEEELFSV